MANNETSFKREIREVVKAVYGKAVHMWNTTDKFVTGIPDTMLTFNGLSIGWEAKFVTTLPARETSKVLAHPVSGPQMTFLKNNAAAGGVGLVVVGAPDDAVFIPVSEFDSITGNINKGYFLTIVTRYPRVRKINHKWQVEGILEQVSKYAGVL